jgi:CheY-like chemotaxis protein
MSKFACVLLVDDDEIANFIHHAFLEEAGVADQILIAQNGMEALQLIRQGKVKANGRPALILLDINMPVMNGHEFLDAFSQLDTDKKQLYKVVVLSSSSNSIDIDKAYQKGADDYLNKPLERAQVNTLIDKLI